MPPGLCHVTGVICGDVPTLGPGSATAGKMGQTGKEMECGSARNNPALEGEYGKAALELQFGVQLGEERELKILPVPKGAPRKLEMDLGQGMEGEDKGEGL